MFVLINELKLKKKNKKNRENMKSILTLIQLANLVISQDVPQGEVKSNNVFTGQKDLLTEEFCLKFSQKAIFCVGYVLLLLAEFQTKLLL